MKIENFGQTLIAFGFLGIVIVGGLYLLPWKKMLAGREIIMVVGEAKSKQKSQIATFSAGVTVVKDKKDEAVKEVNEKVAAIIEALKNYGIKAEDIKTQNISIYQAQEQYWEDGKQKVRQGQWNVSNSVEVVLRDVDRASGLADLITSSGANNVYGPTFSLDDTAAVEIALFGEAMKDAKARAEAIAEASGRKLGKVVGVAEGYSGSSVYGYAMKEAGGGGSAVEPGTGTVSKTITVSFEME